MRIAAVLHCVEHGPIGDIEKRTIAEAIEIARYLVPHAGVVLNLMLASEETADDDAQYLLRWIKRHGREEFSKSEAQHHGKRRFPKADDIDPALETLTQRGYIRPITVELSGRGRPRSPTYEVNPAFLIKPQIEKRSQYSRNCIGQATNPDSGNNRSALGQAKATEQMRF